MLRLPIESDKPEGQKHKKMLCLVAACSDNYVRFFNLQGIIMSLAFKGKDHNGVPLSFDFSPCKTLISVGFEDDSFITYHFTVKLDGHEVDIIPIMRGVGHKNFI